MMRQRLALEALILLLATSACATVSPVAAGCVVDLAAEERAIRSVSASYADVRDVETEVAQYTEDVWFFSTLTPVPTRGREARRQSIERRRAPAPGEYTRRETSGVMLSECGDLAVEHGRFVTTWPTTAGVDSVSGYYLLTYRKMAGEWKVAAASVHRRPAPNAGTSAAAAAAATRVIPSRGYALQPHEGEQLHFCDTPELSVVIKISPATAPGAQFVMGTADLAPGSSNFGRHSDADEIVYFVRAEGFAVIGADTAEARPGTTLFVPRGVRHGFVNRAGAPMHFVWLNAPPGLEERFREAAQPEDAPCPASAPR